MSKGSANYKSRVVPLSGLVVTWGLGQGADWKTPALRTGQGRMVLPPLHRPCSVPSLHETEMQGEPCLSPRYTAGRSQSSGPWLPPAVPTFEPLNPLA